MSGDLVYVHYARIEDMQKLKKLGISVEGKICMARYGKIYRGNKLKHCQDAGALGIIFFSDPADVAIQGTEPENVYPNTIFLPGSGVQRGSTLLEAGDPLSPDWASIPNAHRLEPEEITHLPKIPAQPIGYDDAKVLLEHMGGEKVPPEWQGGINITYKLGGVMAKEGYKVRVTTHNYFGTRVSIFLCSLPSIPILTSCFCRKVAMSLDMSEVLWNRIGMSCCPITGMLGDMEL